METHEVLTVTCMELYLQFDFIGDTKVSLKVEATVCEFRMA